MEYSTTGASKAEEGTWRLSAKNAGTGQYSAVADLKNWKDGDYGLSIGADTQEPERVPAVVYPNSNAYLAMDGAAAPKGVTFGGGTKSDSFNGSAHDDVITTGGGLSNYVMAFSGDDMVVGGGWQGLHSHWPEREQPHVQGQRYWLWWGTP